MQGRGRRPAYRVETLVCRDDGEAVMRAKRLVEDHDVELWADNRFVFQVERKRR
jgi:hypothetical protein